MLRSCLRLRGLHVLTPVLETPNNTIFELNVLGGHTPHFELGYQQVQYLSGGSPEQSVLQPSRADQDHNTSVDVSAFIIICVFAFVFVFSGNRSVSEPSERNRVHVLARGPLGEDATDDHAPRQRTRCTHVVQRVSLVRYRVSGLQTPKWHVPPWTPHGRLEDDGLDIVKLFCSTFHQLYNTPCCSGFGSHCQFLISSALFFECF